MTTQLPHSFLTSTLASIDTAITHHQSRADAAAAELTDAWQALDQCRVDRGRVVRMIEKAGA